MATPTIFADRSHRPIVFSTMTRRGLTLTERFWLKVDRSNPDGCWLWIAAVDGKGYGLLAEKTPGSKRVRVHKAHRYSWELVHGPIFGGLFVLHRCDTPECVNPDHLFLGTHADNMRDMVAKGRWKGGRKRGPNYRPRRRYPRTNAQPTPELLQELARLFRVERVGFFEIGKRLGISRVTAKKWMLLLDRLPNESDTVARTHAAPPPG